MVPQFREREFLLLGQMPPTSPVRQARLNNQMSQTPPMRTGPRRVLLPVVLQRMGTNPRHVHAKPTHRPFLRGRLRRPPQFQVWSLDFRQRQPSSDLPTLLRLRAAMNAEF